MATDSDNQFEAALRAGQAAEQREVSARAVAYNPAKRELELVLKDGRLFKVSVDLIEGLRGASDEALRQVELTPAGVGLHWGLLDVDVIVPSLVQGIYGTKAWMAHLGQRGGRVSSRAKVAAARSNGKKGGRPRKALREDLGTRTSESHPSKRELGKAVPPALPEAYVPSAKALSPLYDEDVFCLFPMPRGLYEQLVQAAKEQGVQLEDYLVSMVALGLKNR